MPPLTRKLFDAIRPPDELPWALMHESRLLAEYTLDIIAAAMDRIPIILLATGAKSIAPALFTGLLHMCSIIDLWIDVSPPPEENYTGPQELFDKVVRVSGKILNVLGNLAVVPEIGPSPREILAGILRRTLELANG